jgi:beta-exotoxin I transport system permease protein
MYPIARHTLRKRRTGLLWWSLGVAGLAALLAAAYPTVRGNIQLDATFADLSPGVKALLGLGDGAGLTSPVGYLNSQYFANLLPIMVLIFGVGVAAWTVAGDENAGTLELLLANPISRVRVALERIAALVMLLTALAAVSAVTLGLLAPSTGLDAGMPTTRMIAATVGAALLALVFAALAFAVGAATGSRPAALGVASGVAVLGYVIEGLADQVPVLRRVQAVNPWHWLLGEDPLRHGLSWHGWLLPLAASTVLITIGILAFARRDLR